ncbi:translation initiation factor IF-2 subunit alpha [Methanobacterium petrolearium]|uniref:translation initiation factor IF-2 subunit alpha n=1 Tax=Methanobacterium petrolearium TaxID=710190 RepID=UPI001AEB9313|nr:translation initiation factor IF-2 subunit alpha [Methanobacterium petrolearium]MBP1944697.1 translation initiation factor 2 subunit 1 [Methanobacterium petrolearium]BDZ69961.1 translation initiation factor IF-2 subunit alpha [Methanobacterium petrolearium]
MVRMKHKWPQEGDLIVATVHKVLNYGAFAKLEEYPGEEAFIHISEVSAGWVKNIRDYVRENQKIVARVLRVNPKKGHVDVSMKRIREDQRTRKIQQWKIEQKAEKLLEFAAKSINKDLNTAYDEVGYAIMDEFGDLYGAFEISAEEGADSLIERGMDEAWANAITEVAKKNISPPEVQITGYVDLTSYAPDGVEIIRSALSAINKDDVSVQCVGAPRYRLLVKSSDYITAETILKEAADKAIATVLEADGEGEFRRELE